MTLEQRVVGVEVLLLVLLLDLLGHEGLPLGAVLLHLLLVVQLGIVEAALAQDEALEPRQVGGVHSGAVVVFFATLAQGTSIKALASGMGHSVAILSNGDVLGWGGARKGQLGDSLKRQKIAWTPTKVEGIPFRATAAVCGREFTVVFGQREAGEFVVLGDRANRWGVMDVPSLSGRGYSDIGASWHGIYVHAIPVGENPASPVVAWGRNDRGQLPPPGLPEPVKIAVGSEHVLALLEGGVVATFGWGEHGNCGPDTDESGNVSGTYNVVSLPDSVRADGASVIGVGAGCATSWLIVK